MILVVDMNWQKASLGFYEFVLPIVSIAEELDEVVVKHYAELTREDTSKCDAIILSGTPLQDHATLNQTEKFEWTRTCEKPLLGICAGMQTLGLVFGLSLKNCLGIGMTQVSTLNPNLLFSSTFKAYALHNFSVAPSSDDFEVLAESAQCIQAIKHRQRDVYGVLFHPEVRNKEIIQRFVHAFGHDRRV
jgi:GMP synthase-like glutamine amidotransferase